MLSMDKNKPTRKDALRLIVAGVQKHFTTGQLILAGQNFNLPTDLVALLQGDIDATDAADKARAACCLPAESRRASACRSSFGTGFRPDRHQAMAARIPRAVTSKLTRAAPPWRRGESSLLHRELRIPKKV
jgi:hypothetical protein